MTLFRGSGVTGTGTDVAFLRADNNLSDVDSASTSRSNLGLGSLATQPSTGVSITGGTITGITDLAVADGGTGSSTASGARTALGLVIGTDVQAWDAGLDDIAALAVTDGNFIVGDGTNWVAESAGTARTSLGLGTSAVEDVGKTIGDVAQYEDDGSGNPVIDHPNIPFVNGTSIVGQVGLGVDQTWQDLTGSRSEGVVYTNTTGRPILVSLLIEPSSAASYSYDFEVDGVLLLRQSIEANVQSRRDSSIVLIPTGSTYELLPSTSANILSWFELR